MDKQRFPSKAASTMVKIKNGVYVSRNDPNYYRKILQYRPSDEATLYGYAKQLAEEGKSEAVHIYRKAAAYGHAPSIGKLVQLEGQSRKQVAAASEAAGTGRNTSIHKRNGYMWLFAVSLFFILLAFTLILCAFLYQKFIFEKTEYHYHYSESTTSTSSKTLNGSASGKTEPAWNAQQLMASAVYSAVENYRSAKGIYPANLDALTGKAPNNWLSVLPSGIHYENQGNGYSLSAASQSGLSASSPLELDYYPDAHVIGLASGGQLLALFPVASGSEGANLPFTDSSVHKRVVDPNGGRGALGTRGLELQEGYAIHGTNDESSIGQAVTKGCLRLHNSDMEALYPYVPLGTKFKSISGSPVQTPIFEKGLPAVPSWNNDNEKTPDVVYHWKA